MAITGLRAPRSAIPYFEPRYCKFSHGELITSMEAANVDAARSEQNGSRAADLHLGSTLPNTLEDRGPVPCSGEFIGASVRLLSVVRPNWTPTTECPLKTKSLLKRVVESGFPDSVKFMLLQIP